MLSDYSFGKISYNGVLYTSDFKIIRGEIVPNWIRKKGHVTDIEDIMDILDAKPDIIVIGKGYFGLMSASKNLRSYLKEQHIDLIEEKTSKALQTFNKILQEKMNGACGFHLTC